MNMLDIIMGASGLDAVLELNQNATSLEAGGKLYSAFDRIRFGANAKRAADFRADQLDTNAGQAQAMAQRAAINSDRESELVASQALASAAASGGGASDPTVVNLIARNASESAYRKAVALFEGDSAAQAMKNRGTMDRYEGGVVRANEAVSGVWTGMGAGSTLVKGSAKSANIANLMTGMAKNASLLERFGGQARAADPVQSKDWYEN